jgi:hypothetical protein
MKLQKELRQRLAKEYRFAATRMQQEKQPARRLFYFSVFFSEAQRTLNLEWDRDLALVQLIAQHVHAQMTALTQTPLLLASLPIDQARLLEQLSKTASDMAAYFEKREDGDNKEELFQVLGSLAEVGYVASGNGSYLYEKGVIKF